MGRQDVLGQWPFHVPRIRARGTSTRQSRIGFGSRPYLHNSLLFAFDCSLPWYSSNIHVAPFPLFGPSGPLTNEADGSIGPASRVICVIVPPGSSASCGELDEWLISVVCKSDPIGSITDSANGTLFEAATGGRDSISTGNSFCRGTS